MYLLLMPAGDPDKKLSFVEQWQGQPLVSTTVITCMDTIKQAIDEVRAWACLGSGAGDDAWLLAGWLNG